SPKLNGVRAVIQEDGVKSSSLIPIPNKKIQEVLMSLDLVGLDGELISGSPTDPLVWNKTTSCVMSEESDLPFTFRVFDDFTHPDSSYIERYTHMMNRVF